MPVSPQDFALWSRMTGNPMPRTPAEQMALAPQVFQFNRQLGQGQNPLLGAAEAVSSTIDKVGKTALGLGLVAGAGLLTGNYLKSRQKDAGQAKPAEAAAAAVKEEAEELPAVVEEAAKGAASGDILAAVERAKAKSPAELRAGRMQAAPDLGDASEIFPKDLDLYEQHTQAMHRRSVSDRAQQFLNTIGVTDAVAAAEDVQAPSPAPEVATAVEAAPIEAPDSVQFARERARGVSRAGLLAQQEAKAAAGRKQVLNPLGAEPPVAGMADPYALREVAARQTRVEIPATQTVIPQPGAMPGRLQLDDEVAVDNDVIASNPLSTTAAASQDITGSDPASAIGQRINVNQTGAAAAARAATEVKPTVASKLSQQQSPVHLEQDGSELIGAPAAGAVEAFRKGRQYQEMTRQNPALRPIPSPTTEGVSSADIYPTVVQRAPVQTVSPSALGEQPPAASVVTPGVRRTADQDEQELLMRKYAGLTPKAQPAAEPEAVIQTVAPASTRTSDFLARFSVPKEVGGPVREVTFGPGSEMGVNMRGTSYPYAAQDPFREAVGAYMSGEEQGEMGSRGGILTGSGLGPKFGLMQKLGPEGVPVQSQTSYRDFPGYMDEKQVQKVMASEGKSTEAKKAQAQRHVESKLLMRAMEKRAAERTAARGAITETFSGPDALAALRGTGLV